MIGRWGRATRALRSTPPERVLDLGCAFGFGSARLPGRTVVGFDRSAEYLRQGRKHYPNLIFVEGDALALPFAKASFTAVVALDVLEHLSEPTIALAEIARVLRPGGQLVLSVPNRGALAWLDSLNLYQRMRTRWPALLPLDPTETGGPSHRHFSVAELRHLLAPNFILQEQQLTGTGWPELVNLALLLWCRGLLRSERLYRIARYAYFTSYLLDDLVRSGGNGYHLCVVAERQITGELSNLDTKWT